MRRVLCAISTAGLLAGCGGEDQEAVLAAPLPPAGLSMRVEVAKFKYVPKTVEVRTGGTVTWTNRDSAPHTSTSDDGAMEDFDTRRYDGGERARVRFDQPGRFAYYCRFHPFMTGTVEVS